MHQDHVTVIPPGFHSLGHTEISPNQILLKPQKYLSVQGHPEFTAGFVEDLVEMRRQKGIFSNEFVEGLSKNQETDSVWFADLATLFLENKI
jgi:GMP synthase-like glutamine amidotransferase